MSYFVEEVKRLMGQNRVSQIEISNKTDLLPSQVSHILRGKQIFVTVEDVPKFARALARTPHEHTELLVAYLKDHLPKRFVSSKIVEHKLNEAANSKTSKETPPRTHATKLAPELEEALSIIRERIPMDANMRTLILSVSKYAVPPA